MGNFYRDTPLEGKCLKDFIEWYEKQYSGQHIQEFFISKGYFIGSAERKILKISGEVYNGETQL